jgi:hypothetical protein
VSALSEAAVPLTTPQPPTVVLLTEAAHPRDVTDLKLRVAEVRVSPAAQPHGAAIIRVLGGEYGGRHRLHVQPAMNLAPRDSDESFAEFAVRCRRAFCAALAPLPAAGAIILVTHAPNVRVCAAYAVHGERGLSPLFADTPQHYTGIQYQFRDRAWHPLPFGR